jgi:hypothetical protein
MSEFKKYIPNNFTSKATLDAFKELTDRNNRIFYTSHIVNFCCHSSIDNAVIYDKMIW